MTRLYDGPRRPPDEIAILKGHPPLGVREPFVLPSYYSSDERGISIYIDLVNGKKRAGGGEYWDNLYGRYEPEFPPGGYVLTVRICTSPGFCSDSYISTLPKEIEFIAKAGKHYTLKGPVNLGRMTSQAKVVEYDPADWARCIAEREKLRRELGTNPTPHPST